MGKINVILVEDDKVDSIAFERLVKDGKLDYSYNVAASVSQAKKIISTKKYDVAVLDYNIGNDNAFSIFDSLKDTPIIITTGQGREEVAVKAMKMGAYDYLIKDPERKYLRILPLRIVNAIERKKDRDNLKILSHAIMSESDSVCITDTADHIIYVNDAFISTYGFTKEEVMGKHIKFLWKKSDNDISTEEDVCKRRSHYNWEGETENWKKDDSSFAVYISRSIVRDDDGEAIAIVEIARDISKRKATEKERDNLIDELKEALAKIKTLSTLLPICSSCKKIRDDKGYWNQIEVYISKHTDTLFSHGLCPTCAKKLYPQLDPKLFKDIFPTDENE